jgi:hypothetical protein
MERAVDFHRDRRMRCGQCDQAWAVDLAWIERWLAACAISKVTDRRAMDAPSDGIEL